jgi:hypothetical protein
MFYKPCYAQMDDFHDAAPSPRRQDPALSDANDAHFPDPLADGVRPGLEFEPVRLAHRSGGWTPEKQRAFIHELADCGIVREAAVRVGMNERGASRLCHRPDAASFRRAWDKAMRMAADHLRSVAYERAVNGTLRKRYYHGRVVGEERVYDNRLLACLIAKLPGAGSEDDAPEDEAPSPPPRDAADPLPATPLRARDLPYWRGEDGEWRTNYFAPPGFAGLEEGHFGQLHYSRRLTDEEAATIEAAVERWRVKDTLLLGPVHRPIRVNFI